MPRLSKGLILHVRQHEIGWECIIKTYSGTEEAELHIFGSQGKAAVWKPNFTSRGNEGRPEERKRDFSFLAVKAEQKRGSGELHIIGSPGRDEIRKWTFKSLEVLTEQVRKRNEIFRSPGRAEVWKVVLQSFGRQG